MFNISDKVMHEIIEMEVGNVLHTPFRNNGVVDLIVTFDMILLTCPVCMQALAHVQYPKMIFH